MRVHLCPPGAAVDALFLCSFFKIGGVNMRICD
jgi:hypothetical protein